MKYITIALAKGRLAQTAIDIFGNIGLDVSQITKESRKLIFEDQKNMFKFILVKASDVPTYVERGAADMGIVGKDTILEEGLNVYEMLDLGFGECTVSICGRPSLKGKFYDINGLRVATKYVNIARDYFHVQKGKTIDIIKLNGSVELAPLVSLSDVIVDIVESGRTLEENGLCRLEDICSISARIIVNKISMKTERQRILKLVDGIRKALV